MFTIKNSDLKTKSIYYDIDLQIDSPEFPFCGAEFPLQLSIILDKNNTLLEWSIDIDYKKAYNFTNTHLPRREAMKAFEDSRKYLARYFRYETEIRRFFSENWSLVTDGMGNQLDIPLVMEKEYSKVHGPGKL